MPVMTHSTPNCWMNCISSSVASARICVAIWMPGLEASYPGTSFRG